MCVDGVYFCLREIPPNRKLRSAFGMKLPKLLREKFLSKPVFNAGQIFLKNHF